jgi:hypothetical protein
MAGAVAPAVGGPAGASAQPRVWKVGEAAFSIDPLSSQGVQAALRSAWQAAACIHTAVHRPADASLARAFHTEQSARAAALHGRLAAGFHAEAARRFGTAFWQRRAQGAEPVADSPPPAALPPLQQPIALDRRARWRRVPCLAQDFIVESPALCHPALEAPLSFIAGRPAMAWLSPLLEPGSLPTVSQLLKHWRERAGEEQAVALFSSLWRQGVLAPAAC